GTGFELWITGNSLQELKEATKLTDRQINAANIKVLGFIDDLDTKILNAKYFLSPTIFGAGLRIKILHALSLSSVCFISELDLHMIRLFKDRENVVAYSNFDVFYEKFLLLENTPEVYRTISSNALKLTERFRWIHYVNIVENDFRTITSK